MTNTRMCWASKSLGNESLAATFGAAYSLTLACLSSLCGRRAHAGRTYPLAVIMPVRIITLQTHPASNYRHYPLRVAPTLAVRGVMLPSAPCALHGGGGGLGDCACRATERRCRDRHTAVHEARAVRVHLADSCGRQHLGHHQTHVLQVRLHARFH